jgi:hypothetical protein
MLEHCQSFSVQHLILAVATGTGILTISGNGVHSRALPGLTLVLSVPRGHAFRRELFLCIVGYRTFLPKVLTPVPTFCRLGPAEP